MNVLELWLPIVLSGLATHFTSFIAWTVSPHHKPDWEKLSVEDEFQDWLDAKEVPVGQYLVPYAENSEEMNSEAFREKMEGKCRGMLILWASPPNMGIAIGKTLAFFFVAAFIIGYLASLGLPRDEGFLAVFQFVTIAGLLTHCAGIFPNVFWFRRRVAMDLVDGALYAVITGLLFASLWPGEGV